MLERGHPRTKVLATLGPACGTRKRIREMVQAGVDAFRINMSHGDQATREGWVRAVKEVRAELDRPVALVVDLRGPRIRLGALEEKRRLVAGEKVDVVVGRKARSDGALPVDYHRLFRDVQPGHRILIRDGRVELAVRSIEGRRARCVVKRGDEIDAHHGVNLPDSPVSAPALSARDREDVRWAVEQEVDWLALSFVRSADDLATLRRELGHYDLALPVIAKIESAEALRNLDEIIAKSNAVMVARGDLAVELGMAVVPTVQKRIVRRAMRHAIPVIVATQMLETMIASPQPTRAEVSDVGNAVLEGVDAVMLSGETAVGKHPLEACRVMQTIIQSTEAAQFEDIWRIDENGVPEGPGGVTMAAVDAAVNAAKEAEARIFLAFTESGRTARLVASYRARLPIVALTWNERSYHRMALFWGVRPGQLERMERVRDMNRAAAALLRKHKLLGAKHLLVSLTGTFRVSGATNTVRIITLDQLG